LARTEDADAPRPHYLRADRLQRGLRVGAADHFRFSLSSISVCSPRRRPGRRLAGSAEQRAADDGDDQEYDQGDRVLDIGHVQAMERLDEKKKFRPKSAERQ
jgi:hypothetical protein